MKRVVIVALVLLFQAASFQAVASKRTYGAVQVDEVTSIYDGDTFTVNIKNWPAVVGERISVRVRGIDTPELRAKCVEELTKAREAKQFTVAKLRAARHIELRNISRDKYFRLLADVWIDGQDLAASLMKSQLARPYDGGRKVSWCD